MHHIIILVPTFRHIILLLTLFSPFFFLQSNNGPGVSGSLVDQEGFPRADIDIPSIRAQRQRLAVLQTDHKTLMKEIDHYMHVALAPSNTDTTTEPDDINNNTSETPTTSTDTNPTTSTQPTIPPRPAFAKVDEVSPDSPAADAGLQLNDEIIAFGDVSLRIYPSPRETMTALPALLRNHVGRQVEVVVRRMREIVNLQLTPRQWSGNGLLGCHIVPLQVGQVDERYAPDVATAVIERTVNPNSMQ